MRVSRQNASAMRGQRRMRSQTVSCGMNSALVAQSELRLWSITSICRLCKSGMSPGMWNENICRLLTFVGQLVAVDEALQDEAALGRAVALPHEVLTGANRLDGPTDS